MIKYITSELDLFHVRFGLYYNQCPTYSSMVSKLFSISVFLLLSYTFIQLVQPIINM